MKKRKQERVPTKEDAEIVSRRAAGDSVAEIAEAVGMSRVSVYSTLKRLEPMIAEALRASNYGLTEAVAKMVEMTDAKRTEFFTNKGEIINQVEVADNSTQLSARREMLRIHCAYPDQNETAQAGPIASVQIIVTNIGNMSKTESSAAITQ